MTESQFTTQIFPTVIKLWPRLRRMGENSELMASWARCCGAAPAETIIEVLRKMKDSTDKWPKPSILRGKLLSRSPSRVESHEDRQEREKIEIERSQQRDILAGISEADQVDHYLVYCASSPSLEIFATSSITHPAAQAAICLRVASGLGPTDLMHSFKNRKTDRYEMTPVSAEAVERVQQRRSRSSDQKTLDRIIDVADQDLSGDPLFSQP